MLKERSLFGKMVTFIVILLVPIALLYAISNQRSTRVVEEQIRTLNQVRLATLSQQLDLTLSQLYRTLLLASRDPALLDMRERYQDSSNFERINLKRQVLEKLRLSKLTTPWPVELSVAYPALNQFISTDDTHDVVATDSQGTTSVQWKLGPNAGGQISFIRHIVVPGSKEEGAPSPMVLEISVSSEYIGKMLLTDAISESSQIMLAIEQDTLLYRKDSEAERDTLILSTLEPGREQGSRIVSWEGEQLLVTYESVIQLGAHLVTTSPLVQALQPIEASRNWFYSILALLFLAALTASYMLYLHIYMPILELIRKVSWLKEGNFNVHITMRTNREFNRLFELFNDMAATIGDLIETNYAERIRANEARLKQLQSQINPHFLYNCLSFIKSMALQQQNRSIIAMVENMGDYYRAATRTERNMIPLQEELSLVRAYLDIQNMRWNNIDYEINLPEEMMSIPVPSLILQPIVENSLKHGVVTDAPVHLIEITGRADGGVYEIRISDNGRGLNAVPMADLQSRLSQPMGDSDQTGYGTWNVNQRLIHHYGEGSGLHFAASPLGGLTVVLRMERSRIGKGEGLDASSVAG